MPGWIGSPWSERPYINPTTNRVQLSITGAYLAFALAEARSNFTPGVDFGGTQLLGDIPSPWQYVRSIKRSAPVMPSGTLSVPTVAGQGGY